MLRSGIVRCSRFGTLIAALALIAGVPAGAASAHPLAGTGRQSVAALAASPGECPRVMPLARVHAGEVGTGWTVVQGHKPRPFRVNIRGVFPDGVAPGRDMIIVKVSDLPGSHFISAAGGIWAGMSGSPVYINNRLVGSVSFGFTTAPSPIGGLTPAQDMLKVLDYPKAAAAPGSFSAARATIPQSTRAAVARIAGISPTQASSFDRLRLPLAVSGLSAHGRALFQQTLDKAGYQVIVTPGSARAAPTGATFQRPKPGGNFAGLLAYGDVTSGGIGTTTYVCHGRALAFGHPLNLVGPATYGASNASAVAIVRDNTFGSFKLATIGGLFGVLDQDRLAGIRARLGVVPTFIPIIADVRSVDSGHRRIGETDATTSAIVPGIAPFHLFADTISVVDAEAAGSSLIHWTVRGHDGGGNAWSLARTNRFASLGDIPFESTFELQNDLFAIADNPFTDITFDSVTMDARVTSSIKALNIETVLISTNGGAFRNTDSFSVHPGDVLTIRVTLRRYHAGTKTLDLSLTVPSNATTGGALIIAGGASVSSPCGFDPCGTTLHSLLGALAAAPMNNDLLAELDLFRPSGDLKAVAQDLRHEGGIVSGNRQINVIITP